jgi:hypothetical protein
MGTIEIPSDVVYSSLLAQSANALLFGSYSKTCHVTLHPCHLHANIARFEGLRWHIWLAGLGLRSVTGFAYRFVYRKCTAPESLLQRTRFLWWRATGMWPVVPRRAARG